MQVEVGSLGAAERAFVERLGRWLDRPEASVVDALFAPPDAPGGIATTLTNGRFTRLCLRALGDRLRWGAGAARLELDLPGLDELRELDVSGLGLDALDLSGAPALERLDCSTNRLKQLDLQPVPGLTALTCTANDLMVLDARHLGALGALDAAGNALTAILLAEGGPLRSLRCARNQIMVLEPGDQPNLIELSCARNALVRLTVHAPALRLLDVSDNHLTELDVAGFPALDRLLVARNRLGSLQVGACGALREVDAARNYLDRVDLASLERLEQVDVANNQLERLTIGPCPSLLRLECGGNRLQSLELSDCPSLLVLRCESNSLERLELGACPALCELSASDNHLERLALDGLTRLARLDLDGNPLVHVDLRGSASLARLDLPAGCPDVAAREAQHRLLPALRARAGLPVGGEPLDRFAVHALAVASDDPDRELRFLPVVCDPDRCALGTAVMLYWLASPQYYLQFTTRDDVPAYALDGWDLVEAVEARVRTGAYRHDDVFFDPSDDQQTTDPRGRDWTAAPALAEGPHPRAIPAVMTRACGVKAR